MAAQIIDGDGDALLAELRVAPLPQEDGARLDRDGYLVVPDVLDGEAVAAIREALPALARAEAQRDPTWRPRSTLHVGELADAGPLFDAAWSSPPLLAAIAHLLGPAFVTRGPSLRAPTTGHGAQLLHRSLGPPRAGDLFDVATVVVPLVDFTAENGGTRVIPGSHRRWLDVPDYADRPHSDEMRVMCRAGAGIVFSEHLFHSGTTNHSTIRRDALITSYRRRGHARMHHSPLEVSNETFDRLGAAAFLLID